MKKIFGIQNHVVGACCFDLIDFSFNSQLNNKMQNKCNGNLIGHIAKISIPIIFTFLIKLLE